MKNYNSNRNEFIYEVTLRMTVRGNTLSDAMEEFYDYLKNEMSDKELQRHVFTITKVDSPFEENIRTRPRVLSDFGKMFDESFRKGHIKTVPVSGRFIADDCDSDFGGDVPDDLEE